MKSKSNFPNLFGDTNWQTVTCRFKCLSEMPPLNLISNVNLVPFKEDRWLVLRLQTGVWEVPGGTLEPGESYSDAISRELIEEAGARLISFELLGAWHCFCAKALSPASTTPRILSACGLWSGGNHRQPRKP